MVNWTIKKHRHRWYAYGKKPKRYLGADGKPHRYVHYFKSKSELVRAMKLEPLENYKRKQKMTTASPFVDWSQPLQTDETPARKARLICDDRADKGEDYNYVVLVENRIGKEVVWYCNKHGLVSQTSIRIVNVPAKTPYGREEWEKLTRVRDRAEPTKSYSIGTITHSSVAIGSMFYEMDHAATLFLTMDGKELYK